MVIKKRLDMEPHERIILLKFFINKDFFDGGVFDLTIDEFSALSYQAIKRDLCNEYKISYGYCHTNYLGTYLRLFSKDASDEDFIKLSHELLYYYIKNLNSIDIRYHRDINQLERCENILNKYVGTTYILYQPINYDEISDFLHKATNYILNKNFSVAITEARTLVEKTLIKGILLAKNEQPNNFKGNIEKLIKEFQLLYNMAPEYLSDEKWKELANSIFNIVRIISKIRNEYGNCHAHLPSMEVYQHHAEFVVNSAASVSLFLINVIKNKFNTSYMKETL